MSRARLLLVVVAIMVTATTACGGTRDSTDTTAPVSAAGETDVPLPDTTSTEENPADTGDEIGDPSGGIASFTVNGVTAEIAVDCHFVPGMEFVSVVGHIDDPVEGTPLNSAFSPGESSLQVQVGDTSWWLDELDGVGEVIQLDIDVDAKSVTGSGTFVDTFGETTTTGVFSIECDG